DRDGKIRRVFIGTYLPDETPDIREDNPFKFSFSFEIAEKYLASRGPTAGVSAVAIALS
ncbi:MAG: hypothetical protein F6K42_07145, partial [Leptolyngbya sp. SIO1D8]|nr:hypothetical protein [Leptolyngbya sp. SIO1D8]